MNKKLIRITTVPMALRYLLPGQMKFMKENGFDVLMISADGIERNEVIQNETCEHIIVPMTRQITPLQDLKCLFALIKIFKKEKPDIVHTHTPKAGLLGMLAARISGVNLRIHTVGGMPLLTRKGFSFHLLKFLEKLTYFFASQVWPNSGSLMRYILREKLAPERKVTLILNGSSNGIDLSRFNKQVFDPQIVKKIKDSIKFDDKNFYLFFLGRLVCDKGIVELVNVFKRLSQKYVNLRLILAGKYETELDPLPQQTIAEIENNNSIIYVDWTQVGEYYMSISNCFIFPSHREGFPNVLLQAGAMQLPIICSNIPGNSDIVDNMQTGLIFEKGNETELHNSIKFAIDYPEKMKLMAHKLFEKVNKNCAPRAHLADQHVVLDARLALQLVDQGRSGFGVVAFDPCPRHVAPHHQARVFAQQSLALPFDAKALRF